MNDLLQEFAETLTNAMQRYVNESRARRYEFWRDFIERSFQPGKWTPINALLHGSVTPIVRPDMEDEFLEMMAYAGYKVQARSVFAELTPEERKRRKRHLRHGQLHARLFNAIYEGCKALWSKQ